MGKSSRVVEDVKKESEGKRGRPKKREVPEAVAALAAELGEGVDTLLGWQVYTDKVVIIGRLGQKFSKRLDDGS